MASLTGEENMKFLAEGDHNHGTFMPVRRLNHVIDLDVSENTSRRTRPVLLNDNLTHFPMVSYIGEYLNIISTEMNEALMGQHQRGGCRTEGAGSGFPAGRLVQPNHCKVREPGRG